MNSPAEQPREVEVCDHITCLIDLLAQRVHLAGWSEMPLDDVLTEEMTEAIQKSAGVVYHYRQQFEEYAREFNKPTIPQQMIATLPPDRQEFYYRVRATGISTQQFSDTFVVYAPLQTVQREPNVLPVFGVLFACCVTMLESLASGVPLRGGVDIGVGLELSKSNFYGPSLATAYHLESEVAEYPRIVACENVVEVLDAILKGDSRFLGDDDLLNDMTRHAAKECRELLAVDDDGSWVVDYLGNRAWEVFESLPIEKQHLNDCRNAARDFAFTQLARFRQEGDKKHTKRYTRLCDYFRCKGVS